MSSDASGSPTLELIYDCGIILASSVAIALSCKLVEVFLLTDAVLGLF